MFSLVQIVQVSEAMAWDSVLAALTRTEAQNVPYGRVVSVPLNDAGVTSLTFRTTQPNQRVVIQYNAECTMRSPSREGWLHVAILIDGVNIPPTTSNSALCSGTDVVGPLQLNSVSATAMGGYNVPVAGTHRVTVKADLRYAYPGDYATLDDSTIIVIR
jgi:hypothetical protein